MVDLRKAAAGDAVCQRHQEPLKLFCQEDEALICVVCDRAKEHRGHRVVPAVEAAQEYQNQIGRFLDILLKERENILEYQAENKKESQNLLDKIKAEKEKTAGAFSQLRQFLGEQEKLLQTQMEEVEKAIAKQRDEHQATLSAELFSLDSLIRELEEKQKQPTNKLLQNIGSTLKRCKRKLFENPVAFPVALKWNIHDFCDINSFLEAIMNTFKDALIYGLQLQEAKVTLDPATAHPQLVLSEDHKSVQWTPRCQDLPKNPERFDIRLVVLGREGFTSGRHFWEVSVGSEGVWLVGVARRSVRRKGKFDFSPKEGIWALGKWGGEYWALGHPGDLRLSYSEEFSVIRVSLNYAGGRVAFFDADSGAQLFVYSGASFSGEPLLPFFYVTEKAHLTLP